MALTHSEVVESVIKWFKELEDVILVSKGLGYFPNPDVIALKLEDEERRTVFVECKPSNASFREYLTGLGQALAYMVHADYSYLALPKREMEIFRKYFWIEDVGLLEVIDVGKVEVIREAKRSKVKAREVERIERGYGYLRDLKPEEIGEILKTIGETEILHGAEEIPNRIWDKVRGLRNIRSERQRNAWILNIKLALRDLGLIDPASFTLTYEGEKLLKYYNSSKELYERELTRKFLVEANYVDILALIQKLNDKYITFSSVNEFKRKLADEIIKEKLAPEETNVYRDLQDILRILRKLGLISSWKRGRALVGGRYEVFWDKVVKILRK